MKKVLIFSLAYYPFVGGAEVAIKEITDRVSPSETLFHLITIQWDSCLPRTEELGNVTVHRIGFGKKYAKIGDLSKTPLSLNKFYFQIGAYIKAVQLHKEEKFDCTWAMMAHSCAIPAGLFKKRFPNVKYLLTLQEGDPPEHIEKLMRPVWPLFKQGFVIADALQPISTFLQAWGVRMGFKGESHVIPNGVNVAEFSHAFKSDEIMQMKEHLGKKERDVYMVTTSRLVHKNGIDDVMRALQFLPENVSFLIYGIGPDEEKLRALASTLNIEDRVRFMGQIAHEKMPLMLNACDIFIRPSRSEGMGNSFIEAMAAGLPVVATQEGGIPDFLFDEKRNPGKPSTGWAVDPNSPEQIAVVIKDILENSQKVRDVTKVAREMVIKKYDWNIVSQDMRALFAQLLGIA